MGVGDGVNEEDVVPPSLKYPPPRVFGAFFSVPVTESRSPYRPLKDCQQRDQTLANIPHCSFPRRIRERTNSCVPPVAYHRESG